MRFEWRSEGPPAVCGKICRSWISAVGPVTERTPGDFEAFAAQIALAWLLRLEKVIAIPRAGTPKHVRENRAALDLKLTSHDFGELDRAFPPPAEAHPLEML